MIDLNTGEPIQVIVEGLSDVSSPSSFEWIVNISTLIIALAGLFISIFIFKKEKKANEQKNESDRKLELMKTLILDHTMSKFYNLFNTLKDTVTELKNQNCNKVELEPKIQNIFRSLNDEVLLLYIAIDENLFNLLIEESDRCRDCLVSNIGDEGLNLYVPNKFQDYILNPINDTIKRMISFIYNYKG